MERAPLIKGEKERRQTLRRGSDSTILVGRFIRTVLLQFYSATPDRLSIAHSQVNPMANVLALLTFAVVFSPSRASNATFVSFYLS